MLMLGPLWLDPDLMDDRTSDGFPESISSSRSDFNQRVIDRDGTCVMTGSTGFGPFHIIPHAKGDSVCSLYALSSQVFILRQVHHKSRQS
jgi:hypothetical protein